MYFPAKHYQIKVCLCFGIQGMGQPMDWHTVFYMSTQNLNSVYSGIYYGSEALPGTIYPS
jgi:hypothetical protein